MDWMSFIVELSKALAWPLATVVVAFTFRQQIGGLLGRLKKGKLGPAELEFEEAVREIQQRTPELEARAAVRSSIPTPVATRVVTDPRSVVLEAWLKVEAATEKAGRKHAVFNEQLTKDLSYVIRLLQKGGHLDDNSARLYRDVRDLRNRAAHELDFNPPAESVQTFITLAQQLETRLLEVAGEA